MVLKSLIKFYFHVSKYWRPERTSERVRVRSFSSLFFPIFRLNTDIYRVNMLNTEIYRVNHLIQSGCWKIQTIKTHTGHIDKAFRNLLRSFCLMLEKEDDTWITHTSENKPLNFSVFDMWIGIAWRWGVATFNPLMPGGNKKVTHT